MYSVENLLKSVTRCQVMWFSLSVMWFSLPVVVRSACHVVQSACHVVQFACHAVQFCVFPKDSLIITCPASTNMHSTCIQNDAPT